MRPLTLPRSPMAIAHTGVHRTRLHPSRASSVWRTAVCAAATLMTSACSFVGPTQDGCDLCTTSAVVYGTVRDTAGNGVAGALVTVRAFATDTTRPQSDQVVTNGTNPVRTNQNGVFRAQAITPVAPFRARVEITVAPPPPFADTTGRAAATVEFRNDYRGPARDSARVDVVVRRRG